MADRLMSLVDYVVGLLAAQFTTLTVGALSYDVTTEWPAVPTTELDDAEIASPLVWVIDSDETLGETRDMACEEHDVLIVVQMKLPEDTSTDSAHIRALSELSSDIARFMRPIDDGLEFEDTDAIPCCVDVVKKGRSLGDAALRRYYCEIVSTWRTY